MEILKLLVGKNVRVFFKDCEEESYAHGLLKAVDNKGILLLQEHDSNKVIIYIKHEDYDQINALEKEQGSKGVFSAFRQEQNNLFSLE